jgi:pseudaminic acid cytidylyltransferase
VIAIIPARGGSKRIPRKNLKEFNGTKIITKTIEKSLHSKLFSRVIVTTDDKEIQEIARISGAEAVARSKELSDDFMGTVPVIADAIRTLFREKETVNELVCCIYPVTPLLNFQRISESVETLFQTQCDYVFPSMESMNPLGREFRIIEDFKICTNSSTGLGMRTQDLERFYFDAGQFYLGKAETWLAEKSIISQYSRVILLNKYEVIDVDDLEDWKFAEELYRIRYPDN